MCFAIPYYDNLSFLDQAIRSVRAQTVKEWELIVVDDCGPESAGEMVSSFGDPRISYVLNSHNLGLPGNWNECLRLSTGPLVTLVHGDDRLAPSYAEKVLVTAARHPRAAAVFTRARIIGADGLPAGSYVDLAKRALFRGKVSGEFAGDAALAALLRGNFIYCPTLALRKDAVGDAPFDTSWDFVTDWDLTSRLLLAGHSLVGLDEPLLDYRRHAAQTTSRMTADSRRFEEELGYLAMMEEKARRRGWHHAERAAHRRIVTRGHVALSAGTDLLRGRARSAGTKVCLLWRDLNS